jgi:hypothetical protein
MVGRGEAPSMIFSQAAREVWPIVGSALRPFRLKLFERRAFRFSRSTVSEAILALRIECQRHIAGFELEQAFAADFERIERTLPESGRMVGSRRVAGFA